MWKSASRLRTLALLAFAAGATCSPHAAGALPRPCADASDPESIGAVVLAQRQFDAAWAPRGDGRVTHYSLRPQPRHPFAIGALAAPVDASDLPDGLVLATEVRCTVHEVGAEPAREIVVSFAGSNLRLHDATDGWSPPIAYGKLMVFAVRPSANRPTARLVADAPTVLPPEATLRHPAEAVPPLPIASSAFTPSAVRRPGRKAP
jgi:hypothetical protein